MSEVIIEPGLLVWLNSEVAGNTKYHKQQLEYAHPVAGVGEQSKWETTKIVIDPDEQREASKVRDKARSLVRSVCSEARKFGLLCPEDRKPELIEKIDEASELVADFNSRAVYTQVEFNVFWGVVAQDDERAAKAIAETVRDLMADMQSGLAELDVKKVRAIADKARQMGQVLTPEAKTNVDIAVRAARNACKRIVKAGEAVGIEIDRNAIRAIGMARTSFLDIDVDDVEIGVPVRTNGRAVEV